jgi:hypothetical protein
MTYLIGITFLREKDKQRHRMLGSGTKRLILEAFESLNGWEGLNHCPPQALDSLRSKH